MLFENSENEVLACLIENFYKGSLNFSIAPEEAKKLTWDKQQTFLEATVQNELLRKFPVNNEFSRLFLKKLIEYLESYQEVHDDLYTCLCSVMRNRNSNDNFCFRHYVINQDLNNVVTLKETRNMVVNGTTGMRTWDAALILSDWALCNKEVFSNKIILELGSGVGFTGITIAKLCKPTTLILSDCHSDVLNTLCENVLINFPELCHEENSTFEDGKLIRTMILDWNDDLPNNLVPDVLIGADIVYDPSIMQALCNVFKGFFVKNNNLEIYIASVIRNEETYNNFLLTLNAMDFAYEKLLHPKCVFIKWDNEITWCLLKIRHKL